MSAKTKDTDYGYKRILKSLRELEDEPYVKVGFVKGDIAVIAATQEFGTKRAGRNHNVNIPQRSFMRSTFDEKLTEWHRITREMKDAIFLGKETVKSALLKIGLIQQSAYKNRINANIPPVNKQSTIDRKGSSKTLIDTGRMLNSVHFQFVKRGKGERGMEVTQ